MTLRLKIYPTGALGDAAAIQAELAAAAPGDVVQLGARKLADEPAGAITPWNMDTVTIAAIPGTVTWQGTTVVAITGTETWNGTPVVLMTDTHSQNIVPGCLVKLDSDNQWFEVLSVVLDTSVTIKPDGLEVPGTVATPIVGDSSKKFPTEVLATDTTGLTVGDRIRLDSDGTWFEVKSFTPNTSIIIRDVYINTATAYINTVPVPTGTGASSMGDFLRPGEIPFAFTGGTADLYGALTAGNNFGSFSAMSTPVIVRKDVTIKGDVDGAGLPETKLLSTQASTLRSEIGLKTYVTPICLDGLSHMKLENIVVDSCTEGWLGLGGSFDISNCKFQNNMQPGFCFIDDNHVYPNLAATPGDFSNAQKSTYVNNVEYGNYWGFHYLGSELTMDGTTTTILDDIDNHFGNAGGSFWCTADISNGYGATKNLMNIKYNRNSTYKNVVATSVGRSGATNAGVGWLCDFFAYNGGIHENSVCMNNTLTGWNGFAYEAFVGDPDSEMRNFSCLNNTSTDGRGYFQIQAYDGALMEGGIITGNTFANPSFLPAAFWPAWVGAATGGFMANVYIAGNDYTGSGFQGANVDGRHIFLLFGNGASNVTIFENGGWPAGITGGAAKQLVQSFGATGIHTIGFKASQAVNPGFGEQRAAEKLAERTNNGPSSI